MTTKQCSKCRIVRSFDNFNNDKGTKDGKRSQCRICNNEYAKKYRQENREHCREYNKKYKQENREVLKKYAKEYRQENIEYSKEYDKKYRQENKDYYKEYDKKHYQENKDYYKEHAKKHYRENVEYRKEYIKKHYRENLVHYKKYHKEYRRKNSDKFNQYTARRYALKRKATVGIVDYEEIKERDKMNCYLCKNDIVDDDYHFDHVYPLSKGGEHSMNNIKVTHARCNLVKNDRIIDEQQRGVK